MTVVSNDLVIATTVRPTLIQKYRHHNDKECCDESNSNVQRAIVVVLAFNEDWRWTPRSTCIQDPFCFDRCLQKDRMRFCKASSIQIEGQAERAYLANGAGDQNVPVVERSQHRGIINR